MPGFKQFSAQVYDAAHQIQIRICICCPNDPLIGAGFDHHTGQFGCFRYCGNLQDPNACGGCFAPETKILMSDQSYKLVSSLKVGDKVWNPVTGKAAEVYTVSHGPERIPMVQIGFDQSAVEVTDGHPMVINNKAEEGQMLLLESLIAPASLRSETRSELPRGYQVKRADQVKVGDRILGADGRFHTVNVARMLPVRPGQMVHNFIVNPGSTNSDDHMVMADGLVVGDLYLQNKLKKESK